MRIHFWEIIDIYVCQLSIVLREGLTFDISTAKGLVINIKLKTVGYFFYNSNSLFSAKTKTKVNYMIQQTCVKSLIPEQVILH